MKHYTPASVIISKIEPKQTFKAAKRSNQIWDKLTPTSAKVVPANHGDGFEESIAVQADGGVMLYRGPFQIENEPSETQMLLFFCEDMVFVRL